MATMKRIRPTRSFSSAVGGPGAARRETALVFGKRPRAAAATGPMVAKGNAPKVRTPVRFDVPRAALEAMRATTKVSLEADESLEAGTMRVTYDDGSTEILPSPKR